MTAPLHNIHVEHFIPYAYTKMANTEENADIQLLLRYRATGDLKYRNQIVVRHIRMIGDIAAKICKEYQEGVPELLQEGVIGFMVGIDKYDIVHWYQIKKRAKLTSYCYAWARKYMLLYLERHARIVTIPMYVERCYKKMRRSAQAYYDQFPEFNVPLDAAHNNIDPKVKVLCLTSREPAFIRGFADKHGEILDETDETSVLIEEAVVNNKQLTRLQKHLVLAHIGINDTYDILCEHYGREKCEKLLSKALQIIKTQLT